MLSRTKQRFGKGIAVTAMLSSVLIAGSAHADPSQFTARAGVGSDTTQDVLDALAGYSNGTYYLPVSDPTTHTQINSFDAVPSGASTCITTRIGGAAFTRPNGSGAGRKALAASNGKGNQSNLALGSQFKWGGLSAALNNTTCNGATVFTASNATNIRNQVDFARASSLNSGAGTDVQFIPMAADGVSVAYWNQGSAPKLNFTTAELTDLYTNGPAVIGTKLVIPCDININSGTRGFFGGKIGLSGTMGTAGVLLGNTPSGYYPTQACSYLVGGSTYKFLQENQSNDLQNVSLGNASGIVLNNTGASQNITTSRAGAIVFTAGSATVTDYELIAPHSAGSFIAQVNGKGTPNLPVSPAVRDTDFGLTQVNGACALSGAGASDCAGGAAPLTASVAFYNPVTPGGFGRLVYNAIPVSVATTATSTDPALNAIFVGSTSPVCQATTTITAFGFVNLSNYPAAGAGAVNQCGDTPASLQRAWEVPSSNFS